MAYFDLLTSSLKTFDIVKLKIKFSVIFSLLTPTPFSSFSTCLGIVQCVRVPQKQFYIVYRIYLFRARARHVDTGNVPTCNFNVYTN